MGNGGRSEEQRKMDVDLWIILLITAGSFLCYSLFGEGLRAFVGDQSTPVLCRLLVIAAVQFGVAGLGITVVCLLRRESFAEFGLVRRNWGRSVLATALCFLPYVLCLVASGRFTGYQPLSILLSEELLENSLPVRAVGMVLIAVVWGFFEGFNYAVISDKINRRYPPRHLWLDGGAAVCALVCLLFHPLELSPWGVAEAVASVAAVYGMLLVKRKSGCAWGCVAAFCLIWNAF